MTPVTSEPTRGSTTESEARALLRLRLVRGCAYIPVTEPPALGALSALPLPAFDAAEVAKDKPALAPSEKLERLTGKALDSLEAVLDLPVPALSVNPDMAIAVSKLHIAASEKVLVTQSKVDEHMLKAKQTDQMAEMLARLEEVERGLPPAKLVDVAPAG